MLYSSRNRVAVAVKFTFNDDDDDDDHDDIVTAAFDDDDDDDDNTEKSIYYGRDHKTFPAVFPGSVSVKKVWKIPTQCLNPLKLKKKNLQLALQLG